jgi:hypothetical protein
MIRRSLFLACSFILLIAQLHAKDAIVIDWPEKQPAIRFTVIKFRELPSYGNQKSYDIEMSAQNLAGELIRNVAPQFYLFDKNNIRVGDGFVRVTNLGPKETVKFSVSAWTSGSPVSMTLSTPEMRRIGTTIYSVPAGARLKVDGKDVGTTPMNVSLAVGSHMLEFAKEGFNVGTFPLVITPEQLSGGSVTYELGTAAHDSVELRDGTVINGDVEQVNATQVVVRLGGNVQAFNRNTVKRILLIERQDPEQ